MSIWIRLIGTLAETFRIGRGKAVLDASGLTAERTLVLPDASGTIVTAQTTLSGYGIDDPAGILAQLLTVDGAGSALDAEMLNGVTAANYARTDIAEKFGGTMTLDNSAPSLILGNNQVSTGNCQIKLGRNRTDSGASFVDFVGDVAYPDHGLRLLRSNTNSWIIHRGLGNLGIRCVEAAFIQFETNSVNRMQISPTGIVTIAGNVVWHAGNDGPGSGLDADTLDGRQAAEIQTAIDDSAHRNLIFNGGCLISHRPAKSVSNSWQFGQVDLIAVRANGTVTAGDIRQEAVAMLGSTGQAIKVHGLSMDPSGATLEFRVRIEARDARRLKNRAAVFSCILFHDFGLSGGGDRPIDWHVTINKADAADDFATVTQIATGTTLDISPNTEFALSLAVGDMGDCSNGVEVIVRADVDEASGNNVYIADLQLEPGNAATAFARRPYAAELALVHRSLRPCTGLVGKANSGSTLQVPLAHPGLRAAPTYEATAALAFTDAVAADFAQSQPSIDTVHEADADKGRVTCGFFSGLSSGTTMIQRGTGGVILAAAEL
ncbi:MAG: hypothetical protein GVY13_15505 [Alphaproteobacteria bacterium]|jgi:hypothetical protein|nr:hypothetical protein [Alphaproteobacteria bacterium]